MKGVKSVPVVLDPDFKAGYPMERCCFCRTPTPYWTELPDRSEGKQVACCPECAQEATAADVPAKKIWWRREEIAEHRNQF